MKGNKKTKREARQLFRVCLVNGALDKARTQKVTRHLAASKRRGAVAILSALHRLVQLDHDRHTAIVESAAPLDTLVRRELEGDLRRMYGPGIVTSFAENPALLGGVRIKVASDVYDGSIRGRLAALQARL
jgi:F-type H+-transporting ATPase subunit delta